jgi:hypothetical protein
MKPHSLVTVTLGKKPVPNAFEQRFGVYPKGTVLPETQVEHSPRRKVADFPPGFLKTKHIEAMEQNQKLPSCCRHPENHEVEARKSHPAEAAPDVYVFHCTSCGKKQRFFCVALDDERPEWR